ncbi:MAG: transposase [Planctomycetes bacterium]|nr:transposase [Planctomycetota bacterium]
MDRTLRPPRARQKHHRRHPGGRGPGRHHRRECRGLSGHDANGFPLAATLTGANEHDVTQMIPLVNAIPTVRGKPRRPRRGPERGQGDRAYDSKHHRAMLHERGIEPVTARRNTEHGSGLGKSRWVVERTVGWLHQVQKLRLRAERRADIHEALMALGCLIVTSYSL